MDYFIIFITTAAGLYFHGWLYVRIKRWMDRDLALSLAGNDPEKKVFMQHAAASGIGPCAQSKTPRLADCAASRGE